MTVVVIGGTGLIGSKVVTKLNEYRHEGDRRLAGIGSQHPHRRRFGRSADRRAGRGRCVELPVRISSALCQPMAADDVATAVARTAVSQPVGGIPEFAGPDRYPLDDLVRARLRAQSDTRRLVTDPQARYFGVVLDDQTWFPPPPRRCSPLVSRIGSSTTRPLRSGSTSARRN